MKTRTIQDALRMFDQHTTPVLARVLTVQGERMLSVAVKFLREYREAGDTVGGDTHTAAAKMNASLETIAAGTDLSRQQVMALVMARANGGVS